MKYHTTKDGKKILLKDLELSHLQNIIKYIERKAEQGITICYGYGFDADDIYYDEDTIYGNEVLYRLRYKDYIKELKSRSND